MGMRVGELAEVLAPKRSCSDVDMYSFGSTPPCEESLIDVIYQKKKKSLELKNVGLLRLAREEAAVEETIVEVIMSGEWAALKPNSGESVGIGDHYVCVYCHQQTPSYQAWEWNGFIIMFDVDQGTTRDYICGHYFESLEEEEVEERQDGCSENSRFGLGFGLGCQRGGL